MCRHKKYRSGCDQDKDDDDGENNKNKGERQTDTIKVKDVKSGKEKSGGAGVQNDWWDYWFISSAVKQGSHKSSSQLAKNPN